MAVGAALVRGFARGHPGIRRAAPQVSDRTRAAHREISFILFQPEYSPDRRGARVVLSGYGLAGAAPRRRVAQDGSSDPPRATAEARQRRWGLLRTSVLLPPIHSGFLYAPVRDHPDQQDRAAAGR